MLPRGQLMEYIDRLAERRVTFIHAPAGYGKTFTARMWAAGTGCRHSLLALDQDAGQKSAEFLHRFAAALSALQPSNRSLCEIVKHASFNAAPYEYAVNALRALEKDNGVFIIDDLHLLENDDIARRLPDLLHAFPSEMRILLLSRAEPPDCLAALLLKDEMSMLDAEHLKFTVEEIRQFFGQCKQNITTERAHEVYDFTGGWAIGINAVILSGKQEINHRLAERHLNVYIRDQVWRRWDMQTQDFMLSLSVTDEITHELAKSLTGIRKSEALLDELVRENAFLSVSDGGVYRFHHLFRDFLRRMLDNDANRRAKLYKTAGDYYFKHASYYKAVEFYIKCGDTHGISHGLSKMYDYHSVYASIEDTLGIIHMSVDDSIVDKHPFLLEVQAWAAFVEGRAKDLEDYLDRYYAKLPAIIMQNSASAQTSLLMKCMDYRIGLADLTKKLKLLPLGLFAKANTPSITQNMPHFHRGGRDFSEYAFDTDKKLELLARTVGVLFGDEYVLIDTGVRAGVAYERGELNAAHRLALQGVTSIREHFAPELMFAAYMLYADVLNAQSLTYEMNKILEVVQIMIDRHKAYYLNANFTAHSYRLKLEQGDAQAAEEWLQNHAEPYDAHCKFYHTYIHLTTARALIATSEYAAAATLLQKLCVMSKQYRRPLDYIETNILLAIAYWKKGRGLQKEAYARLESAIEAAQPYGYTQPFANEGAELVNLLHKTQKRISQQNYDGSLAKNFVRTLYIGALERSKRAVGLTGGRTSDALTFTDRQLDVMRLLYEGHSHKAIADKLSIAPSAVKSHLILIYKKLDVPGAIEAVMKIREFGLPDGSDI